MLFCFGWFVKILEVESYSVDSEPDSFKLIKKTNATSPTVLSLNKTHSVFFSHLAPI